jgi:cytoskeletal protein CcmA (bactofilin family)
MRLNLKRLLCLVTGCLLLCGGRSVFAATFNLGAGQYPPCSTSWSVSGDTYSCTGNGRVSLGNNDIVTASRPSTLQANNGFSLGNGRVGSASAPIALLSSYGTVTSSSGAVVVGDIQANANILLTGTSVTGSLRANSAGITLSASSITGSVSANNAISLTDTDVTGAINSSNGTITANGGTLRGDIDGGCCDITLANLSLHGNVSAKSADINLINAAVTGNLKTTNRVSLDKSTVNGNVTAATWNAQTIKGTGNSFIYGVCVPQETTPAKLCTGEETAGIGVHHYQLAFASQALTCQAQAVTVTACMDAECSTQSTSSSSLTIAPSGSSVTFVGQGAASVAVRTAQTVTVAITGADPAPSNPTLCRIDGGVASTDCRMTFNDSGFVIRNLSPMIAGKPQSAAIQAVRKSDSGQACVPGFSSGTRTLQFSASHVEPDGPSGSARTLRVGNADLLPGGPAQSVPLAFDDTATAPLPVTYLDAGMVRLYAAFTGSGSSGAGGQSEEGLQMTGSADFVSRPFGLCLETDLAHDPARLFAGAAAGETVQVAGDPFELRIRAVAWMPGDEDDPVGSAPRQPVVCANPTTPNYRHTGIGLRHDVLEPTSGAVGNLSIDNYDHHRGDRTSLAAQGIDEVGVFRLTATPPVYFGQSMAHAVSRSGRIGRFVPARLAVSGAGSLNSCDGLSYQGEWVAYGTVPTLTVTALGRQGNPVGNYDRGAFWRLASRPALDWQARDSGRDLSSRLAANQSPSISGADDGDGSRGYGWSPLDDQPFGVHYSRPATPDSQDLPFSIRQHFPVSALTDLDGVCHRMTPDGSCGGFNLDLANSEIRLGRLWIGSAHGSELEELALPWSIQSWQAPGVFLPEAGDSCSAGQWSMPNLDNFTGNLEGNTSLAPVAVTGYRGLLVLSAPGRGHTGSATAGFPDVPDWLWYDWRGEGTEASRGLATFGIYGGPKPLIFRRELYRGL